MFWKYEQDTGKFIDPRDQVGVCGYSGCGQGINNPAMQGVKDVGPIPLGIYTALIPRDTQTHGPYAIPLVPDHDTALAIMKLGRGPYSFMLHGGKAGDNPTHGSASMGCIIENPVERKKFWGSGIHEIHVVLSNPVQSNEGAAT